MVARVDANQVNRCASRGAVTGAPLPVEHRHSLARTEAHQYIPVPLLSVRHMERLESLARAVMNSWSPSLKLASMASIRRSASVGVEARATPWLTLVPPRLQETATGPSEGTRRWTSQSLAGSCDTPRRPCKADTVAKQECFRGQG